ncbi:hypothetical protein AWB77_04553 [Caballeronia fortuita]|uniref:Uncharacterized protein n=1 Tax=Caballeronia fortuita TaxID=1777138 RepID=A0A158CVM5_9BURK|nr:hypothetical protein AWB77_04553 [Caballeronia fortuita]
MCVTWQCAGLLDRQNLTASAPLLEIKQRLAEERASIESLRAEMQKHHLWLLYMKKNAMHF